MTMLQQLTYTIPENHIIQLPEDMPTGARVRIVIEEMMPTPNTLATFLAWLDEQPKPRTSIWGSPEEVEAYIQECRNDWD